MKNFASSFIGFYKVAELLIQKGADVNAVGNGESTPILYAAGKGTKECLTYHNTDKRNHLTSFNRICLKKQSSQLVKNGTEQFSVFFNLSVVICPTKTFRKHIFS